MTVDPPATEDGNEDAGELFQPAVTGTARPDPRVLPAAPVTRFAPAPTGYLHLGHLVNVLYVWGIARVTAGRVVLRIEDHDRQRSRSEYESALIEDMKQFLGNCYRTQASAAEAIGQASDRLECKCSVGHDRPR